MNAMRASCVIHGLLLWLALGCAQTLRQNTAAASPPPPPPDMELADARAFVAGVAEKMPVWDADPIGRYERVEIARVKADIALTLQEDDRDQLLEDVHTLHDDWNALLAVDDLLKKRSLT